jgi:hypothetical protein
MAVLYINRFDSRCGNCNKSASPYENSHLSILGYTPGPGCGAVFTEVASDYFGMQDAVTRIRPDLPWVGWD